MAWYNNTENIKNNVTPNEKKPIHYDKFNKDTILKLDDYKKINVEYDKREDEPPVEPPDIQDKIEEMGKLKELKK